MDLGHLVLVMLMLALVREWVTERRARRLFEAAAERASRGWASALDREVDLLRRLFRLHGQVRVIDQVAAPVAPIKEQLH